MPTVAFTTLGCKVNQSETETLALRFLQDGYALRDFEDEADVYVVNSCTVTHVGDRKSRQMARQARRRNPGALVVMTGCYAQVAPDEVAAIEEIDLVVPNTAKDDVLARVRERLAAIEPATAPARRSWLPLPVLAPPLAEATDFPQPDTVSRGLLYSQVAGRTRAQLKVQEGCNNYCTYCIVPRARGYQRSLPLEEAVRQVRARAEAGYQEVVLTGIHLGGYGRDGERGWRRGEHPNAPDLGDLLRALLERTSIPRLRVSSLEPEDFDLDWLDLWSDARLCRHFHLPIQSGSARVLRRMARRYTPERYAEIVAAMRARIPDVAITTDIIVGFPGEDEDDHRRSREVVGALAFADAHVFRYSPREGTAAARMDGHVSELLKRARSEEMIALTAASGRAYRERFLGQTVDVLWEHRTGDRWSGLTDTHVKVGAASEQALANRVLPARVTSITADGADGVLGGEEGGDEGDEGRREERGKG